MNGANPHPITRLVYHVLQDRTAIFVVTVDNRVHGHIVLETGRNTLAGKVRDLRIALEVDVEARGIVLRDLARRRAPQQAMLYREALQALYQTLIAPVEEWLPAKGEVIAIEPHGPLWLLPFAALLDADGRWFGEHWSLLFTPSAELLQQVRSGPGFETAERLTPLIVGNPTMPDLSFIAPDVASLQPLPGAQQEAEQLAQLMSDSHPVTLTGDLAHWLNVLLRMPFHGILHFATHGLAFAERPLESFVVLASSPHAYFEELQHLNWEHDNQYRALLSLVAYRGYEGLLTAQQIQVLSLPADLVVLSACQTGLGQTAGEGIIGLSRAFLIAGASSVLVSQWSVSDRATLDFMLNFYKVYLEQNDKAVAVQQAMAAVRSKPEYEHPRYWAPFVLVGAEC